MIYYFTVIAINSTFFNISKKVLNQFSNMFVTSQKDFAILMYVYNN